GIVRRYRGITGPNPSRSSQWSSHPSSSVAKVDFAPVPSKAESIAAVDARTVGDKLPSGVQSTPAQSPCPKFPPSSKPDAGFPGKVVVTAPMPVPTEVLAAAAPSAGPIVGGGIVRAITFGVNPVPDAVVATTSSGLPPDGATGVSPCCEVTRTPPRYPG